MAKGKGQASQKAEAILAKVVDTEIDKMLTKHAGGRPSKYNPQEHIKIAKLCAKYGATDEEIAKELDIDGATLYRWKVKYPEFCESLKIAKEVADSRVSNSLYRRAVGYEYEEVFDIKRDTPDGVFREHRIVKKVALPDTTAEIFWLKNRDPKNWKDKHDVNVGGDLIAYLQGHASRVNGKHDD